MPEPVTAIVSARTPPLLNYALRCPSAEMEGYVFEDAAASPSQVGYCLLARVGSECRIADLWITGGRWNEAVTLAAKMAAQKSCGAIAINASTTPLRQALLQQGFRLLAEWPLFIKDPAKKLPPDLEMQVSMLDNDAYFI